MFVEIQNCSHKIRFTPEVVCPSRYLCIGKCKLTNIDKSIVTVEINGENYTKTGILIANCKETNCSLQIRP